MQCAQPVKEFFFSVVELGGGSCARAAGAVPQGSKGGQGGGEAGREGGVDAGVPQRQFREGSNVMVRVQARVWSEADLAPAALGRGRVELFHALFSQVRGRKKERKKERAKEREKEKYFSHGLLPGVCP